MSEVPTTPPKLEDGGGYAHVRERLVAMGYLSRPLERYVLGGAARPGSFLRRHAAVSLRVAIATAPLLGLIFALAVVVANRPRFSHVSDFLVLAGGFTLVFALAVFALELAGGLALAAFVRWRGRGVAAFPATAARAGFAVSLVLSAYLAYWWRRRAGDAGIGVDLAGLAILVLVNAVLLRVSSLASLAALVRVSDLPVAEPFGRGGGEGLRGDGAPSGGAVARARRTRLLAPALLAASLLIVGFFIAPRSRAAGAPSPYTRIPVEGRMVVVALDGYAIDDASHRDDVTASSDGRPAPPDRGRDRYRGLLRIARPAPKLMASPASLWTTVATGQSAHGVGALEEERSVGLSSPIPRNVPLGQWLRALLPGQKVAVSSGFRSAKTVWEILAAEEGVASVGWWATWPAVERAAPGGHPFEVVSDRALLALERPSAGRYLIAPASLERRLNASFDDDMARIRRSLGQLAPQGLGNLLEGAGRSPAPEVRRRVEQGATIDAYALETSMKLLADPAIRDLFVYLPGLDIALSGADGDAAIAAGYGAWMQQRLDGLEGVLSPEDWFVVVQLPGRRPGRAQAETPETGTGTGTGDTDWGLFMAVGPRSGLGVPGPASEPTTAMSVLDIAPTLLNLRGLPVSREMEGRSPLRFRDAPHPVIIETYGRNTLPSIPFSSSLEEDERETLERLRSLGYLN